MALFYDLRSFEVICKFNNEYLGLHHFIFKKGKEDEEGEADESAGDNVDKEEMFAKYDTDGDGVLSMEEFKKMQEDQEAKKSKHFCCF